MQQYYIVCSCRVNCSLSSRVTPSVTDTPLAYGPDSEYTAGTVIINKRMKYPTQMDNIDVYARRAIPCRNWVHV